MVATYYIHYKHASTRQRVLYRGSISYGWTTRDSMGIGFLSDVQKSCSGPFHQHRSTVWKCKFVSRIFGPDWESKWGNVPESASVLARLLEWACDCQSQFNPALHGHAAVR